MKQTAVEWFCNEMENLRVKAEITNMNGYDFIIDKVKLLQQAKAMEKEQIIEAYNEGQNTPYEYSESNDVNWYDGNNYYKETFKS